MRSSVLNYSLRQSRRGAARSIVVTVVAIVSIVVGAYLAFKPPPEPEVAQRGGGPAPVLVETVRPETVVEELETLGTARANERVTLASKVTERIESIHFEDGQWVDRGDLLFQLRDAEQRAELDNARAQLAERERQLERVRSVGDSGAVSRSALDEELTRYDSARANVELFESRIEDRTIVAPFRGKLGLRRVSPGELVSSGTELITLSALTPMKVDFTAPERFVGRLETGQRIDATSVAYPDVIFTGVIETVSPIVDPISRAAQVRAVIPNEDQRLRPGMLLQVSIALGERETLTLSESALAPVGNRQFALVVGEGDVAQRREVEVGRRRGGRVEIVSGLDAGERVVTHGYRVTEGQPVSIVQESEVFTRDSAGG